MPRFFSRAGSFLAVASIFFIAMLMPIAAWADEYQVYNYNAENPDITGQTVIAENMDTTVRMLNTSDNGPNLTGVIMANIPIIVIIILVIGIGSVIAIRFLHNRNEKGTEDEE